MLKIGGEHIHSKMLNLASINRSMNLIREKEIVASSDSFVNLVFKI